MQKLDEGVEATVSKQSSQPQIMSQNQIAANFFSQMSCTFLSSFLFKYLIPIIKQLLTKSHGVITHCMKYCCHFIEPYFVDQNVIYCMQKHEQWADLPINLSQPQNLNVVMGLHQFVFAAAQFIKDIKGVGDIWVKRRATI